MVYTPDFILKVKGLDKPVAVETKGYARKDYLIRKKLFQKFYPEYYFVEVNDKKKKKDHISSIFDKYK
jgi:predicted nuclease of restriction endonuclease-like RecB superfamily